MMLYIARHFLQKICKKCLGALLLPRRHTADAAVRLVSHPPRDTAACRDRRGAGPEAHALDTAAETELEA